MKPNFLLSSIALAISLSLTACNSSESLKSSHSGQADNNQEYVGEMPLSPRIIKGKFDNGITYIIRKNTKPENRAELRLVINAGSILEDDSQQGFAHFVEHMAFNGTEDFKKQEIVDYVESIGMSFGAHLNAHTSFNETVYKLQVPTDDIKTLETGIHILENWAHKLSFEGEEIDKERGVVLEEMRARKGAGERLFRKQLPVVAKDSQYALRLPIGTKDVLENGKHEDLIRFYDDWYRPDLMAVIAVGDFEPEQIKSLLEKYFAKIKAASNAKHRKIYTIPKNKAPLISIETDPEMPQIVASLKIKQDLFEPKSFEDYRQLLTSELYTTILNARLREIALKKETAFIGAGSRFDRTYGGISTYSIGAAIKPGQITLALESILREENRAIQHGFTPSELERAKAILLRQWEKSATEVNNTNSRSFTSEYVRHFIKGEAVLGRDKEFEVAQHFMPLISINEVNSLGASWFTKENRIITLAAPETEKANLPNESELITLWDKVITEQTSPYQDSEVANSLMKKLPTAGSVVSKYFDSELETHYWTLSNGAKVILKQTDFKKDQILFSATSDGGNSQIDDTTFTKTLISDSLVDYMGVADFDQASLNKFMQGKKFSLKSKIYELSEKLSGSSSTQDIEHFMQMLHLKMTSPRKDPAAFETLIARITPSFENRFKQPKTVFNDAIREAKYGNDPRHPRVDVEVLKQQDLDASVNFYQQRFTNAADFDFIFVGNIDLTKMESLVKTYLASLPSNKSKEQFITLEDRRKPGLINVEVKKGLEQKAIVGYELSGETPFSHLNNMKFKAMKSALKTILRERLREDKSGVYGVSVRGSLSRRPTDTYKLSINFTCDPNRVDELLNEVTSILSELQSSTVDEKYLASFKEKSHKNRETALKENSFWKNHLANKERYQGNIVSITEYKALVDSVKVEDIQQAANIYFTTENKVIAKLLPES